MVTEALNLAAQNLAEPAEHGLPQMALEIARPFGFPITNSMIVTWIAAVVPSEIIVNRGTEESYLAVGEGLVEIDARHVTIVTDMAIPADGIDEAKAEEARARAVARLRDKISDEAVASVNASLVRSLAQLQIRRRRRI